MPMTTIQHLQALTMIWSNTLTKELITKEQLLKELIGLHQEVNPSHFHNLEEVTKVLMPMIMIQLPLALMMIWNNILTKE